MEKSEDENPQNSVEGVPISMNSHSGNPLQDLEEQKDINPPIHASNLLLPSPQLKKSKWGMDQNCKVDPITKLSDLKDIATGHGKVFLEH